MAKINPVKLKQEAEQFEKAGRLDQAIGKYRQITEDNPRDWNVINKIGDLYAKMNRVREASDEYAKVADFYAKDGFLLKAIAIWRKVNKLDTSVVEPYLHLAELYAKQGLMMEAKSQYQIVVDEYLKRGKGRDAGDVLKKMAEIDPGDLKIRSKLADLYTRGGDAAQAVEEHVAIAEELGKKGHLAEAIQVLEKGLKLDPRSYRLRAELARVHLVQKNYDRAIQHLEDAVQLQPGDAGVLASLGEAYLGARKLHEAQAIFKRLLELNPQDDDSRVQMARLFLSQDDFDRAYEQLQPVVERAVAAREAEKAISLLQQVAQRNPQHLATLEKLVEVYRQFQRENALSAAYSQLTEAYLGAGQFDRAASVLELLVEREPLSQQHRTKLEFVKSRLPRGARAAAAPPHSPAAPPPSAPALAVEPLEKDMDRAPAGRPPVPPPRPAPAPTAAPPPRRAPSAVEISGPMSEEDREFIEEHLAEGRVFRKYGLTEKAIDQFEAIVARFPDNVEAREELRELYREKGAPAKAAEQSLALAEIFRLRGDEAAASEQEKQARQLAAPAAPPAVRPVPAPTAAPGSPEEEEISIEVEEGGFEVLEAGQAELEEGELQLEDDSAEEMPVHFIDEEEEEAPPAVATAATAQPRAAPVAPAAPAATARAVRPPVTAPGLPVDLRHSLEEVEQYVALGFVDDAREAVREVAARYPGHPALLAKVEELGLELPGETFAPAPEVGIGITGQEPSPMPTGVGPLAGARLEEPPPAPPPPLGAPEELLGIEVAEEEALEPAPTEEGELALEADFDLEIGADEPARAASVRAAPMVEDSRALVLDLEGGGGPPGPAEPAGEGLELGDELGELFGAQQAVEEAAPEAATTFEDSGLADIFKEFKKGVDKQLGKEDYDTRYNLGIAYKEMGLVDEAIAEFQLAARDETRLLECSSMLGICFMEKGMPKLAVKWFEKGLAVPGRSDEEYQGLRYDLGGAYAAAGEEDRALSIFTDLYGQNANFRDVAAKVRELRAGRR